MRYFIDLRVYSGIQYVAGDNAHRSHQLFNSPLAIPLALSAPPSMEERGLNWEMPAGVSR